MAIYVQGRTSESNLYDFFVTPLDEESSNGNAQVEELNIEVDHSLPETLNNIIISRLELRISGNLKPKLEQGLASGLEGVHNLPVSVRKEVVSSTAKAVQRWPAAAMGVRAVVHLYTETMECNFPGMSSIASSSSQYFLTGELEKVKIEPSSDKCAVCLEKFRIGSEAVKLPCFHVFHAGCVTGWLKERSTCPLCRSALLLD